MRGYELLEGMSAVDEKYIEAADKYASSRSGQKLLRTVLIAAALTGLFAATAYGAGWFPSVFHAMRDYLAVPDPESQALFEAAEQANVGRKPETSQLPELNSSSFTLMESYYDGETVLISFSMDAVTPEPVVGYGLSKKQLADMKSIEGSYAYVYQPDGDDSLEHLLETGGLSQQAYENVLNSRTEQAKKHDLRNMSCIELDWDLSRTLSPQDYSEFWRLLDEKGRACVLSCDVYPGDHVLLEDGTDLGPSGYQDAEGGTCLMLSSLPDSVKERDELNILLKLKSMRTYRYMELDGHAYYMTEPDKELLLPVTVKRAEG